MSALRKIQTPTPTSSETKEPDSEVAIIDAERSGYFVSPERPPNTACAAERRAIGTRNGEQLT